MLRTIIRKINQALYDLSGRTDQEIPDMNKIGIISKYSDENPQCKTFIETGTYLGATPAAIQDRFDRIYTIEIDPWLYKKAKKRLSNYKNITCIEGDSQTVLPNLIQQLTGPAIFWLDAHYSRGLTGKGTDFTPIEKELATILNSPWIKESVILIDDCECFGIVDDYPSVLAIKSLVGKKGLALKIEGNIMAVMTQ